MKTSESFNEIGKALLAAQKEFGPVVKSERAKIPTRTGGSYEYSYAALDTVMEAALTALQNHGVLLTQETTTDGPKVTVVTRLEHPESSQYRETSGITLDAGSTGAQPIGSAATYARRYDLIAALGVAPQDDDGAAAQQAYEKSRQQKQQPQNNRSQQQSRQSPSPSQKPSGEQSPPQESQPGPPPQKTPLEQIRSALKQAGCNTQADANLILQWATGGVFGDQIPLQAIVDPVIGQSTLDRLRELHKQGVKQETWLQKARDFAEAEKAMAEGGF